MEIILLLILIPLLLNALYLFVFSVAARYSKQRTPEKIDEKEKTNMRFLILIPGYKEDRVIVDCVRSVMEQNYPETRFHCAVLADDFAPSTMVDLKALGPEVFEVAPIEQRNKARALQMYLDQNASDFDACIILDADNILEQGFLRTANHYLNAGASIVQTRRIAKNEENSMARLDALSETINNHIFRKGQRALGFSASLIGSGMVFRFELFKELMRDMDVFSGFDKELEVRALRRKVLIAYAPEISVRDEKVSSESVFVNQRRRWTNAQFFFLKKYAGTAVYELLRHGNLDLFNKVLQFTLLPRVVQLGFSTFTFLLTLFIAPQVLLLSAATFVLTCTALLIPVYRELRFTEFIQLVSRIPMVFTGMLKAMVTSGRAKGKFIHTPHNS